MEEKSKYFHNFSDIFFLLFAFSPSYPHLQKTNKLLTREGGKGIIVTTFSSQISDTMINTSKPKAVTLLSNKE